MIPFATVWLADAWFVLTLTGNMAAMIRRLTAATPSAKVTSTKEKADDLKRLIDGRF
jgi:hypothetical protein